MGAVAALVRNRHGAPLGAVGVVAPIWRVGPKEMADFGQAVAQEAARISARLGFRAGAAGEETAVSRRTTAGRGDRQGGDRQHYARGRGQTSLDVG